MKKTGTKGRSISRSKSTDNAGVSPRRHYSTSERSRGYLGLYNWAYGEDTDDPALKASIFLFLRDTLLTRLSGFRSKADRSSTRSDPSPAV